MNTVLAVIVDASAVSVVTLLACRVLRHRAAALRHMVLAASLGAVAAVPLFEITLPHLDVPVLTGAEVTSSGLTLDSDSRASSVVVTGTSTTPVPTWTLTLLVVWSLGFVTVMAGLLVGLVRLMLVTRRCRPVQSHIWRERAALLSREHGLSRSVAVLECADRSRLLTWGLFRPCIIVPAGARSWAIGRIDVVLAHELAHIVRRDWVVQIAAEIVRAAHWFNPLVWMTSRRLRDESELACDDAVLRRGLRAVDYASHLLAVARHVAADGRRWASAPAVADPSTLERRISAMLNVSRNRATLTRRGAVATVAAALILTVPLAAITLTARVDTTPTAASDLHDITLVPPIRPEPIPAPAVLRPRPLRAAALPVAVAAQDPGSVSGTLRDITGAVLPGVQVALTSTVSDIRATTVSDRSGSFAFGNVPPSTYALVAQLPGFSTLKTELVLASGQSLQTGSLTLQVGTLVETVTTVCAPAAASISSELASVLAFDRRAAAPRLFMLPRESAVGTAALAAQIVPIRVGGQIAVPRRIKDAKATCPAGVTPDEGALVIIEATIGPDGLTRDPKVIRSGDRPEFAQAAIDAIRQWEYTPTRLNNVPIPVLMTVTATFTAR